MSNNIKVRNLQDEEITLPIARITANLYSRTAEILSNYLDIDEYVDKVMQSADIAQRMGASEDKATEKLLLYAQDASIPEDERRETIRRTLQMTMSQKDKSNNLQALVKIVKEMVDWRALKKTDIALHNEVMKDEFWENQDPQSMTEQGLFFRQRILQTGG